MVTVFCNRLGWTHMERLFAGFQTRLFFGVANELLDLIRLTPLLNVQRARALYLAGFTSVAVLARARTKEVERVLQRVNPYSSGTQHEDDRKTQSAIVLSDGSVISEHDLPPLVVARAQELLREDLCANYGVDLAAVSDRVVGTTSSPSPTSTPPSKRRRCSLADALIQRSPRASGCPASRFSPNALKHKISSPVKLSNLLRLNNAPNVTAATLANPSTPTDSNPQEMASLASIDKDGRSVNVIASSSCCEESCLATQSPVPLSLNVEVEESASDSGRTSTTSNFLRHLDNVASLTPSRVQGSSPVLAGKIHASTPSSIQNEAAVLNDTMTFSMMERITENLPQLLSSSVSKIIENSQNSISARVSTHREPMVYENVSSEDIFSSQIHVDNSTGEARAEETGQSPCRSSNGQGDAPSRKQHNSTTGEPLFRVVDVTKTARLWTTFLSELDTARSSCGGVFWLALQPHWRVLTSRLECRDVGGGLVWHNGCAGQRRHGGGSGASCDVCLHLEGIALCASDLQPRVVFWIPLTTTAADSARVLSDLRRLLGRPRLGLVVWDVKWWLRVAAEVLDVDICSTTCHFDPSLSGWLLDPDSGCPRLVEVVDAPGITGGLLSVGYSLDPPRQLSDWTKLRLAQPITSPSAAHSSIGSNASTALSSSGILDAAAQCFLLSLCSANSSLAHPSLEREVSISGLLATSECDGFVLDLDVLHECQTRLQKTCDDLTNLAHRLVDCLFNLGSPREVANILYQRLRLPVYTSLAAEMTASKRAHRSKLGVGLSNRFRQLPTRNEILSQLTSLHPLPRIIMQYRHLHELSVKVLGGLIRSCDPAADRHEVPQRNSRDEVRIACVYRTCTATGRVVSTRPNLQAVPKDVKFSWDVIVNRPPPPPPASTEHGAVRPPSTEWPPSIASVLQSVASKTDLVLQPRSAFKAAAGAILVSADFCHLELRVLAHLSRDESLLRLFTAPLDSGAQDVFKLLAAHWLKRESPECVTDEERQRAKRLCYGLIYGLGASGFASQTGLSVSDAQNLIDEFMHAFPGVANFIDGAIQSAHETGEVRTIGGRVRQLERLKANPSVADCESSQPTCPPKCLPAEILGFQAPGSKYSNAKAERQVVNSIVQGSAADLVKVAMERVDAAVRQELRRPSPCFTACKLVLHLHDELIYEVTECINKHSKRTKLFEGHFMRL
uniref:POLAc domain-containing protein n=1 Tax=Mesocestoides corti TaxID=53468 RepID=A0A5K3FAB2_MESCO